MLSFLMPKKDTINEQTSIKNIDLILFEILAKDKKKDIKEQKKENKQNLKKVVKQLNTFMTNNI